LTIHYSCDKDRTQILIFWIKSVTKMDIPTFPDLKLILIKNHVPLHKWRSSILLELYHELKPKDDIDNDLSESYLTLVDGQLTRVVHVVNIFVNYQNPINGKSYQLVEDYQRFPLNNLLVNRPHNYISEKLIKKEIGKELDGCKRAIEEELGLKKILINRFNNINKDQIIEQRSNKYIGLNCIYIIKRFEIDINETEYLETYQEIRHDKNGSLSQLSHFKWIENYSENISQWLQSRARKERARLSIAV
jgi:hypothetical protein